MVSFSAQPALEGRVAVIPLGQAATFGPDFQGSFIVWSDKQDQSTMDAVRPAAYEIRDLRLVGVALSGPEIPGFQRGGIASPSSIFRLGEVEGELGYVVPGSSAAPVGAGGVVRLTRRQVTTVTLRTSGNFAGGSPGCNGALPGRASNAAANGRLPLPLRGSAVDCPRPRLSRL